MSDAMVEIPDDAPVMLAWKKYEASDEYANARKWALHKEADDRQHVDGSLWNAFIEGYRMCLMDMKREIERSDDG